MILLYQNERLPLTIAKFENQNEFDFKVSRENFKKANAIRTLKLFELGKDFLSGRLGYQNDQELELRRHVSSMMVELDDGTKTSLNGFFFDNINFTTKLHSQNSFDEIAVNMTRLQYIQKQ